MRAFVLTVALLFAANGAADDVKIERHNALLKFTYEWPREASADRRLDDLLRSKAKAEWRERLAGEEDNRKNSDPNNLPFRQGDETVYWEMAGQTRQLLSLRGAGLAMSSGMAHPEHWNETVLWDLRASRQISLESLFGGPASFAGLTRKSYCAALAREQRKRLQSVGGAEPDPCPKYADLAIAPADTNKDGRFDSIDFVAPPYVAGFYALGEFVISLPVTATIVRAIKPEYRPSFKAQRQ